MSFLDEIESNVRSKSEVDEENRVGERRTSMNRANAQIEEAKAELLRKAKNADYEILPSGIKKISYTVKFPKFYFSFDVRDLYKEARERQQEIEEKYRPIINAENNVAKRQKLTRLMMDESDKIMVPPSGTFVSKIWIEDAFLYSYEEYVKHLTLLASEESIDLTFEFFNGKKFSGRATDFPVVFNEFVSDSWSPISIIFSCKLSGTDEIKKSRTNAETKNDSVKDGFVIIPSEKDNSIILEWEKYPNADGYEVLGYELASKECIDYGTTEELFFEDNNIPDESYRRYYQVAAYQIVNGVRKYLAISNTVYGKRKLVKTSIETESSITEADFDSMEGHDFERFCAKILRDNNFEQVSVTRGSGDQGVDVIAYKEGIKYGIQCKCYSSVIGNKAVQEAYAGKSFYDCHVGAVLTNQFFTPAAKELAKKNHILLWDRNKLIELAKKSAPVKKEILEEKLQIVFFKTSEKLFQMKYGRNILKQQLVAARQIIPDRNSEINTGSPTVTNEPEIKNEYLITQDENVSYADTTYAVHNNPSESSTTTSEVPCFEDEKNSSSKNNIAILIGFVILIFLFFWF